MQNEIKVYSLNYDFLPTYAYGAKCLWADVRWAPENLQIGQYVNLVSSSSYLVVPRIAFFRIKDIVGSRIVFDCVDPFATFRILTYFMPKDDLPKSWVPLDHGSQWGYATRDLANKNPAADRNWTYGNGDSVLKIVW